MNQRLMHKIAALGFFLILMPFCCRADSIDVSQVVVPINQGDTMDCWAAATTMLVCWKRSDNNITVAQLMEEVGDPYKMFYSTNAGLVPDDLQNLCTKLGLQVVQQQNLTIQAWADLLSSHGPLFVVVDADPPKHYIHALVITGMKGDGNADSTNIIFNDPGDGQSHTATFSLFLKQYEGSANWPVQIIYWPPTVLKFKMKPLKATHQSNR